MARIRSIHPGFWTDEAVVSVSRDARLLFIGLWNLCDDKGAFEWKPLSIRMQLFPVDDVDISKLLHELAHSDLIKQYDAASRKFGAVRNFCRHQRPKKPNDIHPMPDVIRQYTNQFPTSSEPVPHQFSQEKEDGGGRREKNTPYARASGVQGGADPDAPLEPPNARGDRPKKYSKRKTRANGTAKPPRNGMVTIQNEMRERAHESEPTEQPPPHRGRVVDLTGRLNRR